MVFNFFRTKFSDTSLRKKLFLCLLLLIVIPLILAALFINYKASEAIGLKNRETMLEGLKQTRVGIETIIKETNYLSLLMLADERVQDLSRSYLDKILPEYSRYDFEKSKLDLFISVQSALESRSYINSVCVSDAKQIIFQFGDLVNKEENRFNARAVEMQGRGFWTPGYKLKNRVKDNSGTDIISYVRVINDFNASRYIAFERVSVSEEALCNTYKGINTWKNSDIFIIDNDGNIISASDKKILGQNIIAEKYYQDILKNKEGFSRSLINSTDYNLFYYTIEDTGWHVVQRVPQKELHNQEDLINIFITIAIAICILFGIFFSIVQDRSIIFPLKQMEKEMIKVKKGDFNVKLDIKKKDEIGSLYAIFVEMVNKLKEMIEKVYKSQIKEKEAELIALQAQINPHFLYNTLDSIRWMAVKNKDYAVSDQIEALSDMFKHVLNKGRDETTIGEEIEHLRSYIFIQQNRFGDKIDVTIDVDEALFSYKTIKLILQPIVENSINHGLECKVGKGKIVISIEKEKDKIKYTIIDDGIGTDDKRILEMLSNDKDSHNVFALKNINERIQLKYGKDFGLNFISQKGIGTKVVVLFPAIHGGEQI